MKYKLLGKTGLRVSELCLGTMTFGEEWALGASKTESQQVFEAFAKAGGNFIDTANRYTEGSSERFLADFMGNERDYFVLATKYSLYDRPDDLNAAGNHRKNMMRSVEQSLKRLQTDYIDLLWLHAWDFTTSPEEVMRGLDDLISAGKVHYIGISDTPAWIIAKSNTLAELRGWAAFAALQIEYSLIARTPERELLPMAEHFEMSITPWGALGGGALTGKYLQSQTAQEPRRLVEGSKRLDAQNTKIAELVVKIAQENGCAPAHVALNWLRQKSAAIIPIVGARKAVQLQESLACLTHSLAPKQWAELEAISAIELGFPHDFLASDGVKGVLYGKPENYQKIEHRKRQI